MYYSEKVFPFLSYISYLYSLLILLTLFCHPYNSYLKEIFLRNFELRGDVLPLEHRLLTPLKIPKYFAYNL